jgi:hypothetical protein
MSSRCRWSHYDVESSGCTGTVRQQRTIELARAATTKASVRVTAVASIARTGMFRKHGGLRVSQPNISREKLMLPLKQVPYDPSSSSDRAPCRLDGHAARKRTSNSDNAPLSFRPQEKPRWTFRAALSRLLAETFARIPVHAGSIFPNFVFAVFSRMIAEYLAGCAAYAEAWYPSLAVVEGRIARGPHMSPPASGHAGVTPDLKVDFEQGNARDRSRWAAASPANATFSRNDFPSQAWNADTTQAERSMAVVCPDHCGRHRGRRSATDKQDIEHWSSSGISMTECCAILAYRAER